METKRSFPCWVCKGHGGERDIVIPETGQGPWWECQYCEGEGMILINGPVHKRRRAEFIGMQIAKYGPKDEYTFDELRKIGEKALKLV